MSHELRALSDLETGTHGLVRKFLGGKDFVNHLLVLGFTIGVELVVMQNYGRGPVIVLVRNVRIALGRGEAFKVLVEVLPKV